jgi:hypothetical protein
MTRPPEPGEGGTTHGDNGNEPADALHVVQKPSRARTRSHPLLLRVLRSAGRALRQRPIHPLAELRLRPGHHEAPPRAIRETQQKPPRRVPRDTPSNRRPTPTTRTTNPARRDGTASPPRRASPGGSKSHRSRKNLTHPGRQEKTCGTLPRQNPPAPTPAGAHTAVETMSPIQLGDRSQT